MCIKSKTQAVDSILFCMCHFALGMMVIKSECHIKYRKSINLLVYILLCPAAWKCIQHRNHWMDVWQKGNCFLICYLPYNKNHMYIVGWGESIWWFKWYATTLCPIVMSLKGQKRAWCALVTLLEFLLCVNLCKMLCCLNIEASINQKQKHSVFWFWAQNQYYKIRFYIIFWYKLTPCCLLGLAAWIFWL